MKVDSLMKAYPHLVGSVLETALLGTVIAVLTSRYDLEMTKEQVASLPSQRDDPSTLNDGQDRSAKERE